MPERGSPRVTRANRNRSLRGRSWVYFARAHESGMIKIGQSRQVHRRITVLNAACPGGVELLGTIPETWLHERAALARFAAQRVNGEWFRPSPELLALAEAGRRLFENGYSDTTDHIEDGFDCWQIIKGCPEDLDLVITRLNATQED